MRGTQNAAQVPWSPLYFFEASNFEFKLFKKFQKNYLDVANVVLYRCANFQNEIHCILGSVNKKKSHEKTKSSFSVYCLSLITNDKISLCHFF
jgi:hypothetical protein